MSALTDVEKAKISEWLREKRTGESISRPQAVQMCAACHVKLGKLEQMGVLAPAGFAKGKDHAKERLADSGFVINYAQLATPDTIRR